jgi:hypothetical protein
VHSRVPAALPHALKLPLLTLQDAAAELAKYELLLLLDARPPVANFGYEGGPSRLVTLPVRRACSAVLVGGAGSGERCGCDATIPVTWEGSRPRLAAV